MSQQLSNFCRNHQEVMERLSLNDKMKPCKTIDNFYTIMTQDPEVRGKVRYNEMRAAPERAETGELWSDLDDSELKCYIEVMYGLRHSECYMDAFNMVMKHTQYNPIKSIIEGLTWDGKPRIRTLLQTYLAAEDSDYTSELARVIFMGGVRRLYEPGVKFDIMPIFMGRQGTGKSTFVRWLAINDCYFREVTTIDGQQGIESLEGAWVCEISELLALTKQKEQEAVKSFITRQMDTYRKPFQRRISENPRKCILVGTTNRDEYLTDPTGGRRFYPIKVNSEAADLYRQEKRVRDDILQCWAEAFAMYNGEQGTELIFPFRLIKEVEMRQENVTEEDWREGKIDKYLDRTKEVCVIELWEQALRMDKECTRKDSNTIVGIMSKKKQWERLSAPRFFKSYGNQRIWRRRPYKEPALDPNQDPEEQEVYTIEQLREMGEI